LLRTHYELGKDKVSLIARPRIVKTTTKPASSDCVLLNPRLSKA